MASIIMGQAPFRPHDGIAPQSVENYRSVMTPKEKFISQVQEIVPHFTLFVSAPYQIHRRLPSSCTDVGDSIANRRKLSVFNSLTGEMIEASNFDAELLVPGGYLTTQLQTEPQAYASSSDLNPSSRCMIHQKLLTQRRVSFPTHQ